MELLKNIRSVLTHPLAAGPLGGGFVVLMAYLDAKYRDVKRDKSTYIKLFVVSSLIFATLTYFILNEIDETDEFLDQQYDTEVPSSLVPEKKGGFKKDILDNQSIMDSPLNNVENMMGGLPEPGTFKEKKNVTMKILPKDGRRKRRHRKRKI